MEGQLKEPILSGAVKTFHSNHHRLYQQFKAYSPSTVVPSVYSSENGGSYTFPSAPPIKGPTREDEGEDEEGGAFSASSLGESLAAGDDLGLLAFGQSALATAMAHVHAAGANGVEGKKVPAILHPDKKRRFVAVQEEDVEDYQSPDGVKNGGGGGAGVAAGSGSGSGSGGVRSFEEE